MSTVKCASSPRSPARQHLVRALAAPALSAEQERAARQLATSLRTQNSSILRPTVAFSSSAVGGLRR